VLRAGWVNKLAALDNAATLIASWIGRLHSQLQLGHERD
jgi:hypothetical protein